MSEKTDLKTVNKLLSLKYDNGLPNRDIATTLGLGAATVSDLIGRFKNVRLSGPLPTDISTEDLMKQLYPASSRSDYALPDFALIDIELRRKGVTKLLLWEKYQAEQGDKSYGPHTAPCINPFSGPLLTEIQYFKDTC